MEKIAEAGKNGKNPANHLKKKWFPWEGLKRSAMDAKTQELSLKH
jgi:hypothetical protein